MTPAAELAQIKKLLSEPNGSQKPLSNQVDSEEAVIESDEVKKKELTPQAEPEPAQTPKSEVAAQAITDSAPEPEPEPEPTPKHVAKATPAILLGKPSLSRTILLEEVGESEIDAPADQDGVDVGSELLITPSSKPLSLELFQEIWPQFLKTLQEKAPKFLVLQMERVLLKEFDKQILTVATDNEFGSRMVDEYGSLFSDLLKELTGNRVRILPVVEQSSSPKTTSSDPYQLFMEIQKKDPMLRQIVEKLGAELQYN
jgi:hypothetical protein